MLITLSRRAAICQSDAEVQLTGVVPLGAVSHRFNLIVKTSNDNNSNNSVIPTFQTNEGIRSALLLTDFTLIILEIKFTALRIDDVMIHVFPTLS